MGNLAVGRPGATILPAGGRSGILAFGRGGRKERGGGLAKPKSKKAVDGGIAGGGGVVFDGRESPAAREAAGDFCVAGRSWGPASHFRGPWAEGRGDGSRPTIFFPWA